MKNKDNKNVVEMSTQGANALKPEEVVTEKQKTNKRYLKQVESIVRRLDGAISELNSVSVELRNFQARHGISITEIDEKDLNRTEEMEEVVSASLMILYQMANRMSRKYVGKTIEEIGDHKRKSLKLK